MLFGTFYTTQNIESFENGFEIDIVLNSTHPIFEGHFPSEPVVPGVSMVKLCEEILSKYIGNKLSMIESKQIKFLSIVNPETDKVLRLNSRYKYEESGNIKADFVLSKTEKTVAFKMNCLFEIRG